jgi:hypothetical protein
MKKLFSVILMTAALAMLLCACRLGEKKKDASNTDPAAKVVSIGDESISLATFKANFDTYLPYMQYYGSDPFESYTSLVSFQDWLVDALTDDLVTLHQAKRSGFTLSDEQEKELAEKTGAELDSAYNSFMKYAEEMVGSDPRMTVNDFFEGLVNTESEYYTGVAMSWADYREFLAEEARNAYIVSAYHDKVCEEFAPSDDDITEWYDTALESDKSGYTAYPEKYKEDEELYEQFFGLSSDASPVTYVPYGYYRILHIIVTPEGELSEEHALKLARMDEIRERYAELSFEDAVNGTKTHAAEMEALIREYRELKEATGEDYADFVAEANKKITQAYSELLSGKSFAEVMLRYTEDDRVTQGFVDIERGELISLEYTSENDWSEGVKAQFAKLEKGEYSGVFMDEGSYHIIYFLGEERAGEVPIEMIYDDIKTVCNAGVQDSLWESLLDEWKRDPGLVINEELIRTVGTEELEDN